MDSVHNVEVAAVNARMKEMEASLRKENANLQEQKDQENEKYLKLLANREELIERLKNRVVKTKEMVNDVDKELYSELKEELAHLEAEKNEVKLQRDSFEKKYLDLKKQFSAH